MTEKVTREFQGFRPAYVFDVSQTSGEPLPTLANMLNDGVDDFEKMRDVLIAISPVPISFEEISGTANGYFSPSGQCIVVRNDMSELQTIKTMIHEIAHATLGHGGKEDKWDRETKPRAETGSFKESGISNELKHTELALSYEEMEKLDVKKLDLSHSIGEIAAESIIPYPPGIPIIQRGERITDEMVSACFRLMRNEVKIQGGSCLKDGQIQVFAKGL